MQKMTFDEYIELVKENYNGEIPFEIDEDDFNGMNQPLRVKCKKCGDIFIINRASYVIFSKGTTRQKEPPCNNCKFQKKKDEFFNKLKERFNGELPYEFISDFQGTTKGIDIRCKYCGLERHLDVAANLLTMRVENKERPYCPNCSTKNSFLDYDKLGKEWLRKINKLSKKKDLYTIIGRYNGNKQNLTLRCNICGDEFTATPTNIIQQLQRSNGEIHYCPNCNKMKRSDLSYEERLKNSNPNIKPLEEYINLRTPILHKCMVCGYEWKSKPNNRLRGEGCPKCSNISLTSSYEDWLYKFIKKYYKGKIIRNSRKLLKGGYEIDIYLPDLKIGFEIDGCYYHNYDKKGSNYHLMKTELAERKGISLYHIFTSEIDNKPKIIKDKVLSIIGVLPSKYRVYARKCYIKKINNNKKNKFLDRYHLQGKDVSSINLGLYNEKDKLVAVMTFSRPSIAKGQKKNSKYDYELSRYAVRFGYNVIGGFSKLFKYFERNYKWHKIITYADKRFSKGNVYLKNGFIHTHDSKPNYWYFHVSDDSKLYHRYKFRKSELKRLFPKTYSDDLSEYEIMRKNGYKKVYDCGNMVFEYTKI